MEFCPGARALRQPKPEIFTCPRCGDEVEIWTDEIRGTCATCGEVMYREGMMSCLEWCAHARECGGDAVYDRFVRGKAAGVKRKLLQKLERELEDRPGDLTRVLARLRKVERAADRLQAEGFVVIPAALVLLGLPKDDLERTLTTAGLSLDHTKEVQELVTRFRRTEKNKVRAVPPSDRRKSRIYEQNLRALVESLVH